MLFSFLFSCPCCLKSESISFQLVPRSELNRHALGGRGCLAILVIPSRFAGLLLLCLPQLIPIQLERLPLYQNLRMRSYCLPNLGLGYGFGCLDCRTLVSNLSRNNYLAQIKVSHNLSQQFNLSIVCLLYTSPSPRDS